jgi:GDP-L-fucose synthase
MDTNAKIYVAGHRGLVGSAIVRALQAQGYTNIVARTHAELDLENQAAVNAFFAAERPEYVFLAAALVGGIHANSAYPADFIYNNLLIEVNVIHAAQRTGAKKLLFLGSSCIYPRSAPQPIREEHLLTGELEPTNEPYAVAKIAGIKLCQSYNRQYGTDFIAVMPTNLYGPNDNYHPENSHVLPALIRRFHEAKVADAPFVTAWGTGSPRREFLFSDDCADACVFLMQRYTGDDIVNIGTGEDLTIRELTEMVALTVGYRGEILWDPTKPDGTPRKLLDVSRLHGLGWRHRHPMHEGLQRTYADFLGRQGVS